LKTVSRGSRRSSKLPPVEQEVQLSSQLQGDLKVRFDQVLALPNSINGVPEPGPLSLALTPVLLEVLGAWVTSNPF